MSASKARVNHKPDPKGKRPITDELICLNQATNILKCVEEVGKSGEFGNDGDQLIDTIRVARRLIEGVIKALTAYFAAQGGAT